MRGFTTVGSNYRGEEGLDAFGLALEVCGFNAGLLYFAINEVILYSISTFEAMRQGIQPRKRRYLVFGVMAWCPLASFGDISARLWQSFARDTLGSPVALQTTWQIRD